MHQHRHPFNPWRHLVRPDFRHLRRVGAVGLAGLIVFGTATVGFADDETPSPRGASPTLPVKPTKAATSGPATTGPVDPYKPAMQGNAELYMEIPITGVIGEESFAAGMQLALDAARSRHIREIVLRIDTTRGSLLEINAIVDLIHKTQDQPFRFHALVQNAAWLTTPIVFACSTIHVTPQSTIGGDTLAEAKEAKAKLEGSMSPAKGREVAKDLPIEPDDRDVLALSGNVTSRTPMPSVLLALTIQNAHVFVWKESDEILVSEDRPAGVSDENFIVKDTDNNRLRLSADQAVAIGLATLYTDTSKPPGVPAERAQWAEAMPKGKYYMSLGLSQQKAQKVAAEKKAKNEAQNADQLLAKSKQVAEFMNARIDEADQNDPKTAAYTYLWEVGSNTMRLDGKSIIKWQSRTDAAIRCWSDVKQAAETLISMDEEATKQKLDLKLPMDVVRKALAQSVEKIRYLQQHRDDVRTKAPSGR